MRRLLLLFTLLGYSILNAQELTCEDEFLLSGSAVLQGECIQLTSNASSQRGCAWFHELTDFSQPFTHTMTLYFGTNNANGADGICLVYQSNSSSTCGISGEGIGAQGIPNSFIVEFDTWQNANLGDPVNDHAAIHTNGNFAASLDGPIDLGNIEDGADHTVTFSWDPATMTYSVSFDGSVIMSGVFDIINNCFGGSDMAYWGYTSSTGGSTNVHRVCPGLPPEVVTDAGADIVLPCAGAVLTLDGSASDMGPEFIYEWTTFDGNIVSGEDTPSPVIDEPGTYTLTIFNSITLCENTDEVNVTLADLEAIIDIPPFLDCIPGQITLEGSNSTTGPNITYEWTTPDGNILSTNGANALVDAVGEYTLTVIYDDGMGGFCQQETTTFVETDPNEPLAFATDALLVCDPPYVELDGSGSSLGSMFEYEWTTLDGVILSGDDGIFPMVAAEGLYTLVVTNSITGCTDEIDVFVSANQEVPEAIVQLDDILDCNNPQLVIDGSQSSAGPLITYEWTTPNGHIVEGANEESPTVDQPGDYTLLVTDTENGCTDEITITVVEDQNVPVAAAVGGLVSCTEPLLVLDAEGSSTGSIYGYEWTTINGSIVSGEQTLTPTVSAGGQYTLVVTNTVTLCTASVTVMVTDNQNLPTAAATVNGALGCNTPSLTINGSGSSAGAGISYTWTTSNGNIVSGANQASPTVNQPGAYTLTVSNANNGCSASTTVTVGGSTSQVDAQINASALVIDCNNTAIALDGSNSSADTGLSFAWGTANGTLSGATNDTTATATAAGNYTLTVTDQATGCTDVAQVSISINNTPPNAEAGTSPPFGCDDQTLTLSGAGSSTGNVTYNWTTTNGQLLSGGNTLSPVIGSAGTYALQVTNTTNGCTATDQVVVAPDDDTPLVQIAPADTLDCDTPVLMLNAAGSSSGAGFNLNWTASGGGQLVGGQSSLTPMVSQPGSYTLQITNQANGCSNTSTIVVAQDTIRPVAAIQPPDTLDCGLQNLVLNALGSSQGAQFTASWSTQDGFFVADSTTLQPQVAAPGSYTLHIENQQNHCTAIATVNVLQDTLMPILTIATPDTLDCVNASVVLSANIQQAGAAPSLQWATNDGAFQGNTSGAAVTAVEAGVYTLSVINPANNCAAISSVEVIKNNNYPTADAGADVQLTCRQPSAQLGGAGTSAGQAITYQWSSPNSPVSGDSQSANYAVSGNGLFILQVINISNGCTSTDTVQVAQDVQAPTALIAPPALLTCTDTLALLDASASSGNGSLQFSWTTATGSIAGSSTSSQVFAGQAGIYQLVVTNTGNGCQDTTTVQVQQDDDFPTAQIMPPLPLTCDRTTVVLQASANAASGNVQLQWATSDGQIVAGANSLQPSVNAPGIYILQVEDGTNNCRAQASVEVVLDNTPPTAQITSPDTIDCAHPQIVLDATGSSQGPSIEYQWATNDGQIVDGENAASALVDAAGVYTLVVLNAENGCSEVANMQVVVDTLRPSIAIMPPTVLTCVDTLAVLNATINQAGSNPQVEWTSLDGHPIVQTGLQQATVANSGLYTIRVEHAGNGCVSTQSVQVDENRIPPSPDIAPADTLNCLVNNILLDASASSGASLSFQWSTTEGRIVAGATSATPEVDAGGLFTLLLTDESNGCTATSQLIVMQDTMQPVLGIANPAVLDCAQTAVELQASIAANGGASPAILWTTSDGQIVDGQNTLHPTVARAGSYQLEVVNTGNHCTSELAILVEANQTPPQIQLAPLDTLDCNTPTFIADATGSSGIGTIQFNWTGPGGALPTNEATAPLSEPGIYNLLLIDLDNACVDSLRFQVAQDTVAPLLGITIPPVLDCALQSFELQASVANTGAGIHIEWTSADGQIDGGANTLRPLVSEPGLYAVVVTNTSNGCSTPGQVSVEQDASVPLIDIEDPVLLTCLVQNATLNAENSTNGSSFSYQWTSNNGGLILSGDTTLTPSVAAAGIYSLTIQNQENGCSNSANVQVFQNITTPNADAGADLELPCDETTLFLDGNASSQGARYTYTWTANAQQTIASAQTLTPVVAAPGLYQLQVTDTQNGCTAVDVVAVSQSLPVADLELVQPGCHDEPGLIQFSSVVGGHAPYLYSIDGGQHFQASPVFLRVPAGEYATLVQDANGCVFTETATILQPDPLVLTMTTPEFRIDYGDSVRLLVDVNYPADELALIRWDNAVGLSCTDCLNPVASPTESTLYRVSAITTEGCRAEASVRIFVERDFPIYIPSGFSPNGDGNNDLFYIFSKQGAVNRVRSFLIYDRWGNEVFSVFNFQPNIPNFGWDGTYRGQAMNAAVFVYVAEIELANGQVEVFKGDVALVR